MGFEGVLRGIAGRTSLDGFLETEMVLRLA